MHLRQPILSPSLEIQDHCLDIATGNQHTHRKVLQLGTRTCRTTRTMFTLVFPDIALQPPASRILTSMRISPS